MTKGRLVPRLHGKRRIVSYGWKYDFSERKVKQADGLPAWLHPLRESR